MAGPVSPDVSTPAGAIVLWVWTPVDSQVEVVAAPVVRHCPHPRVTPAKPVLPNVQHVVQAYGGRIVGLFAPGRPTPGHGAQVIAFHLHLLQSKDHLLDAIAQGGVFHIQRRAGTVDRVVGLSVGVAIDRRVELCGEFALAQVRDDQLAESLRPFLDHKSLSWKVFHGFVAVRAQGDCPWSLGQFERSIPSLTRRVTIPYQPPFSLG